MVQNYLISQVHIKGSMIYRYLRKGTLVYYLFIYQKEIIIWASLKKNIMIFLN